MEGQDEAELLLGPWMEPVLGSRLSAFTNSQWKNQAETFSS